MPQSLGLLTAFLVLAADGSAINELLPSMRKNAALYADIEVRYSKEVRSPKLTSDEDPAHVTRWLRETYHAVWQGSLYYSKYRSQFETYAGAKSDFETEYGYDGEFTRVNYQGAIGNIDDRRQPPFPWFPPHNLGFQDLGDHQLADFLAVAPVVKSDQRLSAISRSDSTLMGTDVVDRVECIKIRCDAYVTGDEKPRSRYLFWIAPERNYLILRSEQYLVYASIDVPICEYETSDWRKIADGIWLPFRGSAILRQVSTDKAPKDWDLVSTTSYIIDSVNLHPKYPKEFFSSIEMPKDRRVYIIKGGKIVDTRVNGRSVETAVREEVEE